MKSARMLHRLAWCGVLAGAGLLAQEIPPAKPFQAVHLLRVEARSADAEKTLMTAIAGLNQAIAKAGCPGCIYHLWKVIGDPNGSHNYLQISFWPSRAMYDKIHKSAEYDEASKNWPVLRTVVQDEVYNQYEEIPPGK